MSGGLRHALSTLAVVAALVGALAFYLLDVKPKRAEAALAARPVPPVAVAVERARLERWHPQLNAIATLEAAHGVDVAAEVDGVVSAILFESGQSVEAGAALVRLDDRVLRAELKETQAQLRNAEVELERVARLARDSMTSKSSLDAALSRRDEAAAAVERVQAMIAQKSIRAPFSGRLGVRLVQLGEYIESGSAIVTLQHAQPIHANFFLPESALAAIDRGDPVTVRVDSYAETFDGAVTSFDPKIDQRSRTFLVQATLENEGMKLVPGQFAHVSVLPGAPEEQVTVPETAIQFGLWGDSLYVVQPPGPDGRRRVEQRIVQIGSLRDGRASIARGVEAGEEVVAVGGFKLRNGAAVSVQDGRPAPSALDPRY